MRRVLLFAILMATGLFAQNIGTPVNQAEGPPPKPIQTIFDYAGGSNLTYIGYAFSDQVSPSTIAVSAASNANPVSFTATAHGFDFQTAATTTPAICIAGATGNWTPINGCWKATPTSANAFTIAVDSTTFGALTGTLSVTTRAPLTTAPVWSIKKFVYSGTTMIWSGYASNPAGAGATNPVSGSSALNFVWTNRASLSYQ